MMPGFCIWGRVALDTLFNNQSISSRRLVCEIFRNVWLSLLLLSLSSWVFVMVKTIIGEVKIIYIFRLRQNDCNSQQEIYAQEMVGHSCILERQIAQYILNLDKNYWIK